MKSQRSISNNELQPRGGSQSVKLRGRQFQ